MHLISVLLALFFFFLALFKSMTLTIIVIVLFILTEPTVNGAGDTRHLCKSENQGYRSHTEVTGATIQNALFYGINVESDSSAK